MQLRCPSYKACWALEDLYALCWQDTFCQARSFSLRRFIALYTTFRCVQIQGKLWRRTPVTFVAIFTNAEVQRPTFWYISAQSRFHDVRVRMHVLDPFVPIGKEHLLNYFNHAMFKMPRKLCFKPVCNCDAHHTRLVEYSKILMPCVGKTPSDKLVHSGFEDSQLSTQDFGVFKFKESYEDAQLTRYKTLRLKLWAPCMYTPVNHISAMHACVFLFLCMCPVIVKICVIGVQVVLVWRVCTI